MNINNLTATELDQLIEKAQARKEELKREPWEPKECEDVWIVYGTGVISKELYHERAHKGYIAMGLIFRAKEEAQLKADSMKARKRVREWIARENARVNFVADFSDRWQAKACLAYSHHKKEFFIHLSKIVQITEASDHFSPELKEKILEAFTTEELALAYLGVRL